MTKRKPIDAKGVKQKRREAQQKLVELCAELEIAETDAYRLYDAIMLLRFQRDLQAAIEFINEVEGDE